MPCGKGRFMQNAVRKVMVPACMAGLLVARVAGAQTQTGMHESGGFILSAERLFGLSFWSIKTEVPATALTPGGSTTDSGTNATFAFGSSLTLSSASVLPYTTPRLAFDFLPIESLTLGGSIGYASSTGQREDAQGASRDTSTLTAFAITPRVGYVLPLADWVYFWPRLGFTYFHLSIDQPPPSTTSSSANGFAIDIEPAFVFAFVPHFGITVTPVADIPLTGSSTTERTDPVSGATVSADEDVTIRNFGATVGILGYF